MLEEQHIIEKENNYHSTTRSSVYNHRHYRHCHHHHYHYRSYLKKEIQNHIPKQQQQEQQQHFT